VSLLFLTQVFCRYYFSIFSGALCGVFFMVSVYRAIGYYSFRASSSARANNFFSLPSPWACVKMIFLSYNDPHPHIEIIKKEISRDKLTLPPIEGEANCLRQKEIDSPPKWGELEGVEKISSISSVFTQSALLGNAEGC